MVYTGKSSYKWMIWGYPHFLYLQSMVCHPACGMVRRPLMPARLPWALEIAGALPWFYREKMVV
jgi:hypothetical protein